jgi:transposase
MLLSVREQLVRRRTQLSNAIRGHASEFGLIAGKGLDKIETLLLRIAADATLPALAKQLFALQGQEYAQLEAQLFAVEKKLLVGTATTRRAATWPRRRGWDRSAPAWR